MKRRISLWRQFFPLVFASLAWADNIFCAPQMSAPTEDNSLPISREVELMRQIEPGFTPKDERAVQLFMLQNQVAQNERLLLEKEEETQQIQILLSQKFQENINEYIRKRTKKFDADTTDATKELVHHYEQALKHNAHHPEFAADALYNLGLFAFEVDEQKFFKKLALYNEAREQGRDDVPYPDENFSRTIKAYERLLKEYPNYKHKNSVYYLLSLALWYEGDFDGAVKYFHKIIKEFPHSQYVEEVWFRLAEYYYDIEQFDNAIGAYAEVIKNTASPLYEKAVYKTAWSHYQKDRYDEAIVYFMRVIDIADSEGGEGKTSAARAEALRLIVRSLALELRQQEYQRYRGSSDLAKIDPQGLKLVQQVSSYFERHERPRYYREILMELASQLIDEQKTQGAILAFEKVVALDPHHKDAPRIESQIVDLLERAGQLEDARQRNMQLIQRYDRDSGWSLSAANDIESLNNAREAVRDAMLSLAVYYHRTGKDYKEAHNEKLASVNFDQAAALYAAYVREYPERDDVAKAIFYFAESSFEVDRFKEALDAYAMLKQYPLPMPDNLRRNATFNIIYTFRHVLENEVKEGRFRNIDFDALTAKYRNDKQEEIPPIGQQYLSSIDDFLHLAPNDDQVPVLLFHAAAIYYVYGHQQEAQRRFFYIIDHYPSSAAAVVSARLLVDEAIAAEQWDKASKLAALFSEQNLGGLGDDFKKIEGDAQFKIARAVFEEANKLMKRNQLALAKEKYRESYELFAQILAKDPQNPYADIMLWNSALAVMQSGTLTKAVPLFKELYTKHPRSQYAADARFQEALALEKMLKFAEAARAYDGIIKADPHSELAADALLNKALLYEAAGDDNLAINAFLAFAKQYPARPEAPLALLTAAAINKKNGRTSEQVAMLERFIAHYRNDKSKIPAVIEAHVQVAETFGDLALKAAPAQKQRYLKAQTEHYQKALRLYRPGLGELAAFYAAKAQLFLEKPEQDRFRTMSIKAPLGKEQGLELVAMMKKLTELAAKNEAIIKTYAQPVSNAEALYRIGRLYEHLAGSLLKAPCPRDVKKIDELACDEYTVLLEDKATVLEDKALDAYSQAYEIGIGAYDAPASMIDNIQNALNRLRPGKYPRIGTTIDKGQTGALYGQGPMLKSQKMAATLHPDEKDPDAKREEPVEVTQ